MTKPVYVFGGGGHGRVVLDSLLSSGASVAGIIDPGLTIGTSIFDVPVVGDDNYLDQLKADGVLLVNGLGASPAVRPRRKIFEDATARGFTFIVLQHPSAIVGREAQLKPGAQVMAGAVLQCRVTVGENAVINTRASIDHDCMIGAHAFISPGVVLCGSVTVGEAAFIGAGAVVMPGSTIGDQAIVGAGTVVTKNVPSGWTVVGNPADKIG